jgi:hypothetical protein
MNGPKPVSFHPVPGYGLLIMSLLTQHAPRESRETSGFTGGIATLADGKLYALQHAFGLDGRVSSYPMSARGYSVVNSYMLTQPDTAMLIDTGFGKDEPAIRAEIEELIAPVDGFLFFSRYSGVVGGGTQAFALAEEAASKSLD